jgi:hypothetical protein
MKVKQLKQYFHWPSVIKVGEEVKESVAIAGVIVL